MWSYDPLGISASIISESLQNITNYWNEPSEIIIHNHSYKPTYKKHYMQWESESTLLLGAEIEVDNGGKSKKHAKEVLKIMNGDTWDSEENIYCVHDGSLNHGLEFPTQPCSFAWHKSLPYDNMFEYLDKNGYKAHDTLTCGLHIHINRSFFGEEESECIGKLMYIVEKFNDEFSVIGRRDCRYAKFLGYNEEKCKELFRKGYSIRDKYNAINLLHEDTIEIRAFKGTLKYSTFINTLKFVQDLVIFVKNHSEEEVENMDWKDLYDTFSDDLKAYYDERAEIEKKKARAETENKDRMPAARIIGDISNGSIGFRNGNSISIPVQILESIEDNTPYVDLATPNNVRGAWETIMDRTRESFEISVNSSIADALNELSVNWNCGIEETNEKKLKRLKKQLKTEQNYMAKKELNKQIQELNKEIKKQKKAEKEVHNELFN